MEGIEPLQAIPSTAPRAGNTTKGKRIMTHTRVNHPINLYNGKQVPETGLDRLAILGWKGNVKVGRVAHATRCLSIPVWTPVLHGDDSIYVDILIDRMETLQNMKAQIYATEMMESNNGVCNDIPAYLLDPANILEEWLIEQEERESGNRGKLSQVQIKAWFANNLQSLIVESYAANKGWLADGYNMSAEELKQAEQVANNYRAILEKLSSPVVPKEVTIKVATSAKAALGLLGKDNNDPIARKLGKKLDRIIEPPKAIAIELDDSFLS